MPDELQRLNSATASASQAAARAGASFNTTQLKVNEDIVQALQQLSYVAAGTISLSITFLGYLLGKEGVVSSALETHLLGIPLLWILFASWILLSISVVLGLLYRFFNSWYLYGSAGSDWTEKNAQFREKMLQYIDAGMPIVFEETDNAEEGRANVEESRRNYAGLTQKFKDNLKIYSKLTYLTRRITIGVFIAGMCLLLIFVITVSTPIV